MFLSRSTPYTSARKTNVSCFSSIYISLSVCPYCAYHTAVHSVRGFHGGSVTYYRLLWFENYRKICVQQNIDILVCGSQVCCLLWFVAIYRESNLWACFHCLYDINTWAKNHIKCEKWCWIICFIMRQMFSLHSHAVVWFLLLKHTLWISI